MLCGEAGKTVTTALRNSNAAGTFAWRLLLVLAFGPLGLLAQLAPDIEAGLHALRAQSAIEDQHYARARVELEKILELHAQHDLPVPEETYFRYAAVLQQQGALEDALNNVRLYLGQAGSRGDSYTAALQLAVRVEREIAELEKAETERAARKLAEGLEFVRVPSGTFRMGSKSKLADPDELPLRQVRITRAFEIGKYEVTQSEWTAVMGRNPSSELCQRCPVTRVSWNDVQEFIGILNQAAGEGSSYRLPTEAEWEYAARAGATGEWYASDVDTIAWHKGNSSGRAHPVGEKAPNALGLHDMLGNVWEWVQDWYGYRDYSEWRVTDPVGPTRNPDPNSDRVNRGGGWNRDSRYCRLASRYYSAPDARYSYLGFRLARTVQ